MRCLHRIAWISLTLLSLWVIYAGSGVASYPRPLRPILVSQDQPPVLPAKLSPLLAALPYPAHSSLAHPHLALETSTPTPTYDPLAIPVLPENPTQLDIGRLLYYHNCMPCHGDLGQGLTDEFRLVWVEDHRNCWARGCHGGRAMDEGFPIPTVVPAVMAESDALPGYTEPEALLSYLRLTHPPQSPGILQENEYRALSALLWVSNSKPGSLEAFAALPASNPTASAAAPHIVMNNPAAGTPTATPVEMAVAASTPTPVPTIAATPAAAQLATAPIPSSVNDDPPAPIWLGGLALASLLLVAGLLIWTQRKRA